MILSVEQGIEELNRQDAKSAKVGERGRGERVRLESELSGYKSNRFNCLGEGGSGSCPFGSLNA
jgi:hypothetical protein